MQNQGKVHLLTIDFGVDDDGQPHIAKKQKEDDSNVNQKTIAVPHLKKTD